MAKVKSNPNAPQNYGPAMAAAFKNTKVFGQPMKNNKSMKAKKMSPEMVAKRKRSVLANAATKAMGGLYSK